MSLVVVGLSHRSAPVALLERASAGTQELAAFNINALAAPRPVADIA